jgi:hypothetical protein
MTCNRLVILVFVKKVTHGSEALARDLRLILERVDRNIADHDGRQQLHVFRNVLR